jgi:Flp pilus assembly protein TadB
MSPIAEAKHEWRAFKNDEPGKRFQHQHDRLQEKGRGVRIGLAVAGIVLLLVGVALMVLPGPGLPLLVFGLALLAGLSGALARALDRTEPVLRHEAKQLKRGWHRLSGGAKAGICAVGALGLAAVAFGAYRIVI